MTPRFSLRPSLFAAALAAACFVLPGGLPAQAPAPPGVPSYRVTPALERALAQGGYFHPRGPEERFDLNRRRWKRAWIGSVAALALANALDVRSSVGKTELNPLLRSADGRFSVARGAAVKGGLGAGFVAAQIWMIRRNPDRNLYKTFALTNGAAAGGLGAVAYRNFGVPRPAAPSE